MTLARGAHSSPGPTVVDKAFDPSRPLGCGRKTVAATAKDHRNHNCTWWGRAGPRGVAIGQTDHDIWARPLGFDTAEANAQVGATGAHEFGVTGTAYVFDRVQGGID